jgi:cyclomaltodextrin glucanotransferase
MKKIITAYCLLLLTACGTVETPPAPPPANDYYGTLEPFASEAVYFIVTDRFVDGDISNNYPEQGGSQLGTFDRPIRLADSLPANIGYLGGDFRGILDNAGYIADMGFTSIWATPIVDNPDEAFTGGKRPGEGGSNDRGKTGYHGYWGVNFFEVDEHLESADLSFSEFTHTLKDEYGLKYVLDVVCNHGSPAFTMPQDQPKYGELYDADGVLLADHQNLDPSELDPDNPLHAFYNRQRDLAELSDFDASNPDVLEYFVAAYSKWLEQGAAAFRIDTIKHMPHEYWKAFSDRIREKNPGLFMFAESWSYEPSAIAQHTYPENGGISVLDFPGRQAMNAVFAGGEPYSALESYLHLDTGVYENPYELMTFYDNHDMPRMDADDNGFIDAHNWLFTSRGIPVVYYGSETGFRAGTDQHKGNRDYFGQDNVNKAKSHPIHGALSRIAAVRKSSIALQRGLQANIGLTENSANFYRVYQKDGVAQTALVLLNKSDDRIGFSVKQWLEQGTWRDAVSGATVVIDDENTFLFQYVDAHDVRVFLRDGVISNPELIKELDRLQASARRRSRE